MPGLLFISDKQFPESVELRMNGLRNPATGFGTILNGGFSSFSGEIWLRTIPVRICRILWGGLRLDSPFAGHLR